MPCLTLMSAKKKPIAWICRPTIKPARPKHVQDKWCFECRQRLPHRLHFTCDAWYDPEAVWLCQGCKQDRTWFPA